MLDKSFTPDCNALCNRRAFWQNAVEIHIIPARGKIYKTVDVQVRVDEPGNDREWKVQTVDRMRDKQRIATWNFDRPEIIEFYDETIVIEKGSPLNLNAVMVIDRGAGEAPQDGGGGHFAVPAELAGFHPDIGRQGHQISVSHGVDERRTFFDGHQFLVRDR